MSCEKEHFPSIFFYLFLYFLFYFWVMSSSAQKLPLESSEHPMGWQGSNLVQLPARQTQKLPLVVWGNHMGCRKSNQVPLGSAPFKANVPSLCDLSGPIVVHFLLTT